MSQRFPNPEDSRPLPSFEHDDDDAPEQHRPFLLEVAPRSQPNSRPEMEPPEEPSDVAVTVAKNSMSDAEASRMLTRLDRARSLDPNATVEVDMEDVIDVYSRSSQSLLVPTPMPSPVYPAHPPAVEQEKASGQGPELPPGPELAPTLLELLPAPYRQPPPPPPEGAFSGLFAKVLASLSILVFSGVAGGVAAVWLFPAGSSGTVQTVTMPTASPASSVAVTRSSIISKSSVAFEPRSVGPLAPATSGSITTTVPVESLPSAPPPPPATMGLVRFSQAKGGHRVWIDDVFVGDSATPFHVTCGRHVVKCNGRSYTVDVPCGGESFIE